MTTERKNVGLKCARTKARRARQITDGRMKEIDDNTEALRTKYKSESTFLSIAHPFPAL